MDSSFNGLHRNLLICDHIYHELISDKKANLKEQFDKCACIYSNPIDIEIERELIGFADSLAKVYESERFTGSNMARLDT